MTFGKASLIAVGFVGAMALGVAIAPYVTDRANDARDSRDVALVAEPAVTRAPAPARSEAAAIVEERATIERVAAVAPSAPELQARLKPVLASGTNVEMAADGFTSSEQFATLAHLANNTGVPFVLLKHRVLNEGMSPAEAVTMSKPDLDASLEVRRARTAARADIWAVG